MRLMYLASASRDAEEWPRRFARFDPFTRLASCEIETRELFTCRAERRVDLQRARQRLRRFRLVFLVPEAHREQIVRFGEAIVERHGAVQWIDGEARLTIAV